MKQNKRITPAESSNLDLSSSIRRIYLRVAFFLSGIQGFGVSFLIINTQSNDLQFLLGLSKSRFVLLTFLLVTSIFMIRMGYELNRVIQSNSKLIKYLNQDAGVIIFILYWGFILLIFLLPEQNFILLTQSIKFIDPLQFLERIRPLLIWVMLFCFQFALAVFLTFQKSFDQNKNNQNSFLVKTLLNIFKKFDKDGIGSLINYNKCFRLGAVIWFILLILWGVVSYTGIGVIPDDRFWNIAGVPLLPQQVIFTLFFLLFLLDLRSILLTTKRTKILNLFFSKYFIMLIVWAVAILIWNSQELRHTYFAPGPYPPNNVHYPFSDAYRFDIGGQYFLLGQGLNNNNLTDRPFMMMFTVFLHLLGGQNYDQYIFVQVVILALIPTLVYLIGTELHSKIAGFGMALLIIFKEKNAIESAAQVGIINVKVLMSELPNALLITILALALIYWVRGGRNRFVWPIIAGGALALAVGVRGNSLSLFPLIPIITLLIFIREKKFKIKRWVFSNALFFLGFMIVLLPYSIETTQKYGMPFWLSKINFVIERSTSQYQDSHFDLELARRNDKPISALHNSKIVNSFNSLHTDKHNLDFPENTLMFTLRHFFHNEITTLLIYPTNYEFLSLNDVIDEKSFWDSTKLWQGEITLGEGLFLGLNLFVLSIGVSALINKTGFVGLIPIFLHISYNLSNSLARTSGGRYLSPTDWVIHIYMVVGYLSVINSQRVWNWDKPSKVIKTKMGNWLLLVSSLIIFFLLGSSYKFSNNVSADYDLNSVENGLDYLDANSLNQLEDLGVSKDQLTKFVSSGEGIIELGYILYPRYLKLGENVINSSYVPHMPNQQDRIYFLMLTDESLLHVNFNLDNQYLNYFPNAKYGLILGCEREFYIEGMVFIPLNDPFADTLVNSDQFSCDQ